METNDFESQAAGALFDEDIATADEPLSSISDELRHARILDFQTESLAGPDSLRASLGALTGGLLEIGRRLEARIIASLDASPATMEELRRIKPALDSLLQVARQSDRFAQLEVRLTAEERHADLAKSKMQATALGGFVQDSTRRKHGSIPTRW